MTTWTAPSTGSFHFSAAPGALPHRVEDCTEACREPGRQGWFGWYTKGATIDPDDNPNLANPPWLRG